MKLKDLLKKNKAIRLGVEAKDWKEAVKAGTELLVQAGTVEEKYYYDIIEITEKLGPYYIIAPGVAMPHTKSEDGIIKNSFSFITLKEPVDFHGYDMKPVDILITMAVKSKDLDIEEVLPEIVRIFMNKENHDKIRKAKTEKELLKILS